MTHFLITRDEYATTSSLAEVCAFNRINTLTAIYVAQRGWIGACYSAAEILTALYFDTADPELDPIVLGKGHAAVMQYACLAGRGILPMEELLKYKHHDGPQAHTDIGTPGIWVNTGSLGQALSKCCGLAMADPLRKVYALLGDGELQEGQNFEAFQTIHQHGLNNLVTIIDRNGLQSDSAVHDIMDIPELEDVLKGFGMHVISIDGNDLEVVLDCLRDLRRPAQPAVIIADTLKGAGISFMASSDAERRAYQWHGKAPDGEEYQAALQELSQAISGAPKQRLEAFLSEPSVSPIAAIPSSAGPSTGEAFAAELSRLIDDFPEIRVLDADLEKSCRLSGLAQDHPECFIEMGICEQDMVSCAGGLALSGRIPVVNTYASFFRRAYEQIYVNATERSKVLYAGHYAGLCYATDGKTHQCTGDIAMMRAIPGMAVLYPSCQEEISGMLEWFLKEHDGPAYIRLHRTTVELPQSSFHPGWGTCLRETNSDVAVLTCGPRLSANCLTAAEGDVAVYSISSLSDLEDGFLARVLSKHGDWRIVEENVNSGGLLDEITRVLAQLDPSEWPRIRHKAIDDFTFSTLESNGLYKHFGLDVDSLRDWLSQG